MWGVSLANQKRVRDIAISIPLKGDLKRKSLLMQINSTAELWRMLLKIFDTLFHFRVTH